MMLLSAVDWSVGVPRSRWREHAWDGLHRAPLAERVRRERAALGLPVTTTLHL